MFRDGWLGLDDEDEWAAMLLSRWPVPDDVVRGPPHGDGSVNSTAYRRAAGERWCQRRGAPSSLPGVMPVDPAFMRTSPDGCTAC